jgi:3-phytase
MTFIESAVRSLPRPRSGLPTRLLHTATMALLLLCGGCQTTPPVEIEGPPLAASEAGIIFSLVPEAFVSAASPDDMVDSAASWTDANGQRQVLVSGKNSDQLLAFDGASGELLRRYGSTGSEPGQFNYPNGIFIVDDLAFVVERDNRRVQVLRLPAFDPLGSFGESELRAPYGIWLRKLDQHYEVFVSDAFMLPPDYQRVPPMEELAQRFKRYRVSLRAEGLRSELIQTFGATDPLGAIRVAESLWGDPAHDRLLIAEEHRPTGTRLRLYDLQGHSTGRDMGAAQYRAEAEGIALWTCDDGSGYWIGVDQFGDRTVFHLFDRQGLDHVGSFAGQHTANTDGIWLEQAPSAAFPAGVLYAIHDDQALVAFDWRQIATALGLRERCN